MSSLTAAISAAVLWYAKAVSKTGFGHGSVIRRLPAPGETRVRLVCRDTVLCCNLAISGRSSSNDRRLSHARRGRRESLCQRTHGRSFEQNRIRQLPAGQPLKFQPQVYRQQRISALLEKIVIDGDIFGLEKLLP